MPLTQAQPNSPRVVSDIPGRLRLRWPGDRHASLAAVAERLRDLPGVREARAAEDARSIVVRYDPARADRERIVREAALPAPRSPRAPVHGGNGATGMALARRLTDGPKQGNETIRSRDLAPDKPKGIKSLLAPTLALALAAIEATPVAIAGGALAVASIPIIARATRGLRSRQVTVDEIDALTVGILALERQFLPASAIAWLLSLGEVIRGETVRRSREDIHRIGVTDPDTAEAIRNAPLSQTDLQRVGNEVANRTAAPTTAIGLTLFALRRTPLSFLGAFKVRHDFKSSLRFAAPAPMLNALTTLAERGFLVHEAGALERLAACDAMVLTGSRHMDTSGIERPLRERGITKVVVGRDETEALRREGRRVAMVAVSDRASADLVLMDGDLNTLPEAVDMARRAMQIARQNIGLGGAAFAVNLAAVVIDVAPPPFSTAVNTTVLALDALNTRKRLAPGHTNQPKNRRVDRAAVSAPRRLAPGAGAPAPAGA